MDGVLIIDKPAGPTSHDVVTAARRILGAARVGHTGTLDPTATGVLPLVIGRATRLARFLTAAEKEYVARVQFGWATDTYDAAGRPAPGVAAELRPVTREALEEALAGFRGLLLQQPPPYSAKKIGGVRAYDLARRQTPVEPRAVPVTVHALELRAFDGCTAELRVVSSAGFYVRTLAHDLGRRLGVGGHLAALRRTRSGDFEETAAVPLEALGSPAAAAGFILLDRLLPNVPAAVVRAPGLRKVEHGQDLDPGDLVRWPALPWPPLIRLLDEAGHLIAVAEPRSDSRFLHPSVVLK